MYPYATPSPFPPSFDSNPWAYGFGVFGDVVASALALAMLASIVLEPRRRRQLDRMLGNQVKQDRDLGWTPLFIYRAGTISMLVFVIMRAMPDALWMLAWGEVTESTIRFLLALDLWCDGLALFPMFFSMMCWAWGRQVIAQQLANIPDEKVVRFRRPPWRVVWHNARIVLIVVVIAIGVTIGKASG